MEAFFLKGLFKRAREKDLFELSFVDLRVFSKDKHHKVDDYPFGYRKGMLLRADVIYDAVTSIDNYQDCRLLYTCPKGPVFNQSYSKRWMEKDLIILCGYYKGVDERIFDMLHFERVSLGNFVLSSGELPSLVVVEAILRQIPGVVGHPDCVDEDSILSGLLQAPDYTSPRDYNGYEIPDVVVSGHHPHIREWRHKKALEETFFKKVSLFETCDISKDDKNFITRLIEEA